MDEWITIGKWQMPKKEAEHKRKIAEVLKKNGVQICRRCGMRLHPKLGECGFGINHEHEWIDPLDALKICPYFL